MSERPLKVTRIDRIEDLADQGDRWNVLLDASPARFVFLTFEWLSAWWAHYGDGNQLCVLLAEDGRELVGVAPLYIEGRRKRLRFLGDQEVSSDFLDFILAKGREGEVLAAMMDALLRDRRWRRISLLDVAGDSPTVGRLKSGARSRGLSLYEGSAFPCPVARGLPDTEDAWLQTPDSHFKKTAHRRAARLAKRRQVEYFTIAPQSMPEHFDAFFEMHTQRWRSVGLPGGFTSARKRAFYRDMAPALERRGWLIFSGLRVDGQVMAYELAMAHGRKCAILQTATSAEGFRHGAGSALLYRLLCSQIGKVDEFHFLRGAEPYKYGWGCEDRRTVNLHLWRGPAGPLHSGAMAACAAVRAAVRGPKAWLKAAVLRCRPAAAPAGRSAEEGGGGREAAGQP